MLSVKTYCHIRNNRISVDGKLLFEANQSESLKTFAVNAFKFLKIKYPKFYKMDEISKLGFLAAEVLLTHTNEVFKTPDVGIVLANSQSTLVTDSTFQESISDRDNFYPSPSVFVYTLPNIMLGEISIRHKFRGENAFFIFDRFNSDFISDYINQLGASEKLTSCIGGWVDQSSTNYEAFMYFATTQKEGKTICKNKAGEIKELYELF